MNSILLFFFFSRDVTFSDAGAYSCFALNKFGSIDATGNLVVKGKRRKRTVSPFYLVSLELFIRNERDTVMTIQV